jgi:hypothetical protein
MKNFVLAFALLSAVTSFAAPNGDVANRSAKRESVLSLVMTIAKATHGYSSDPLKGDSARDMIVHFFRGADEIVLNQDKITFDDEKTVGTLSSKGLESLLKQFPVEHHFRLDDSQSPSYSRYTAEQSEAIVRKAILALRKYNVAFGYTGAGGYCGVTFLGLVVFDLAAKKAYTIALAPSGSC